MKTLNEELHSKFTPEELRVLKIVEYTYYDSQNQWSLNKGELFVVETQLGYTKYKAQKMMMKALDTFEKYPSEEVLSWLGYK